VCEKQRQNVTENDVKKYENSEKEEAQSSSRKKKTFNKYTPNMVNTFGKQ